MACPSSCKDENCVLTYREHLLGIGVAPSATPTRGKGWHASRTAERERQLERDLPAYKALRDEGLQPQRVDGAHELGLRAECAEHVETGLTNVKPAAFEAFGEVFGHKATTPAPGT